MPPYTPHAGYEAFVTRMLAELPELGTIVAEQRALCDFEYYETSVLDAVSTAVMLRQGRVLDGTADARDREIVERWIIIGETAVTGDAYVADLFLQTAGDDLLFDKRGTSLRDRLGPMLRSAIEQRLPAAQRGSDQLTPIHFDIDGRPL